MRALWRSKTVLSRFLLLALLLVRGAASQASEPGFDGLVAAGEASFQAALRSQNFSVGEYFLSCSGGGAAPEFVEEGGEAGDSIQESRRRMRAFGLIQKVNFPREGGREISSATVDLLRVFFLRNAGAWFARSILQETLSAARRGFLEFTQPLEDLCQGGGKFPLDEVLTGELSIDGYLQNEFQLFEIREHPGTGAFAQPGFVSFGSEGFRERFAVGGQPIDPVAIVAHEFGHTRYGDPESGGSLEGERGTVIRFENPVRVLDGFEPRRSYYSFDLGMGIEIESGRLVEGPADSSR